MSSSTDHSGMSGRPTTATGQCDPILATCALAWQGNPLFGSDATQDYIRSLLNSTLRDYSHETILSWRRHFIASEQHNRWSVARKWAMKIGVHGVDDIPADPSPEAQTGFA